jgi:hypothetical protein
MTARMKIAVFWVVTPWSLVQKFTEISEVLAASIITSETSVNF